MTYLRIKKNRHLFRGICTKPEPEPTNAQENYSNHKIIRAKNSAQPRCPNINNIRTPIQAISNSY